MLRYVPTRAHAHTRTRAHAFTRRTSGREMNNGRVGRPVARDFGYRNEWRFINIIIIERVCTELTCERTQSRTVCFIIIAYDRFIRLTLPNGRRRPNDRWTAIRRAASINPLPVSPPPPMPPSRRLPGAHSHLLNSAPQPA